MKQKERFRLSYAPSSLSLPASSSAKEPDLSERVAVVTGAASGIGLATALRLADAGARVALLDINAEALARHAQGEHLLAIPTDVSDARACDNAMRLVEARWGRLDILFNNAGIMRRKTILDLSEAEWDLVMAVNVKSIFLMSRAAIPLMVQTGGGSIVNTGSGWGLAGGPEAAAYCAAKGAVVNLTRAMAIDHGPQHIRVNCVCPGDTDTPLLRDEARQLSVDEAEFLTRSAARPLARLGTPLDIADAVLFLASDQSRWITGTTLVVDGGGLAGG